MVWRRVRRGLLGAAVAAVLACGGADSGPVERAAGDAERPQDASSRIPDLPALSDLPARQSDLAEPRHLDADSRQVDSTELPDVPELVQPVDADAASPAPDEVSGEVDTIADVSGDIGGDAGVPDGGEVQTNPCDDGIACTVDHYDPVTGECTWEKDHAYCDDGDFCTEKDKCLVHVCSQASGCRHYYDEFVPCDEGEVCWQNACLPAVPVSPVTHVANGGWGKSMITADGKLWTVRAETALPGQDAPLYAHFALPAVGLPAPVEQSAQGSNHVCAAAAGQVWCWGSNNYGQLGCDPADPHCPPTKVLPLSDPQPDVCRATWTPVVANLPEPAVAVDAFFGSTSCALGVSGSVWCWGYSNFGQAGEVAEFVALPTAVEGVVDAVQLRMGHRHGCVSTVAGEIWCWGDNHFGQLASPPDDLPHPQAVQLPGSLNSPASWDLGASHSCAVDGDGQAWCWGMNWHGQLGSGTDDDSYQPVQVPLPGVVLDISTGHSHTCALTADGSLWCWGLNDHGQLGDGTHYDRLSPVPVKGIDGADVQSVHAGGVSTCALKTDGTVWCWGYNGYGSLGIGYPTVSDYPHPPAVVVRPPD